MLGGATKVYYPPEEIRTKESVPQSDGPAPEPEPAQPQVRNAGMGAGYTYLGEDVDTEKKQEETKNEKEKKQEETKDEEPAPHDEEEPVEAEGDGRGGPTPPVDPGQVDEGVEEEKKQEEPAEADSTPKEDTPAEPTPEVETQETPKKGVFETLKEGVKKQLNRKYAEAQDAEFKRQYTPAKRAEEVGKRVKEVILTRSNVSEQVIDAWWAKNGKDLVNDPEKAKTLKEKYGIDVDAVDKEVRAQFDKEHPVDEQAKAGRAAWVEGKVNAVKESPEKLVDVMSNAGTNSVQGTIDAAKNFAEEGRAAKRSKEDVENWKGTLEEAEGMGLDTDMTERLNGLNSLSDDEFDALREQAIQGYEAESGEKYDESDPDAVKDIVGRMYDNLSDEQKGKVYEGHAQGKDLTAMTTVRSRHANEALKALTETAATNIGSATSKGWDLAQGLVKMTFTNPHALSSSGRAIGLAVGSMELAGDLAEKAAKQYGVNVDGNEPLKEDTLKYRLYMRAKKHGAEAVGNTFHAISRSLDGLGVDDIRQLTPDQLQQHLRDMQAEKDRLLKRIQDDDAARAKARGRWGGINNEALDVNLHPDEHDALSRDDRGLVMAQINHLSKYMDNVSKQAKNLDRMEADSRKLVGQAEKRYKETQRQAAHESRMRSKNTRTRERHRRTIERNLKLRERQQTEEQKRAEDERRQKAQQVLGDGTANKYRSLLEGVDPKHKWEINPQTGLPESTAAIHSMYNYASGQVQQMRLQLQAATDPTERKALSDKMDELNERIKEISDFNNGLQENRRRMLVSQYGEAIGEIGKYSEKMPQYMKDVWENGAWPSSQPARKMRIDLENYELQHKGDPSAVRCSRMWRDSMNTHYLRKDMGNKLGMLTPADLRRIETDHTDRVDRLSKDLESMNRALVSGNLNPRQVKKLERTIKYTKYLYKQEKALANVRFTPDGVQEDVSRLSDAYKKRHDAMIRCYEKNNRADFNPKDPEFVKADREYQALREELKNKYWPKQTPYRQQRGGFGKSSRRFRPSLRKSGPDMKSEEDNKRIRQLENTEAHRRTQEMAGDQLRLTGGTSNAGMRMQEVGRQVAKEYPPSHSGPQRRVAPSPGTSSLLSDARSHEKPDMDAVQKKNDRIMDELGVTGGHRGMQAAGSYASEISGYRSGGERMQSVARTANRTARPYTGPAVAPGTPVGEGSPGNPDDIGSGDIPTGDFESDVPGDVPTGVPDTGEPVTGTETPSIGVSGDAVTGAGGAPVQGTRPPSTRTPMPEVKPRIQPPVAPEAGKVVPSYTELPPETQKQAEQALQTLYHGKTDDEKLDALDELKGLGVNDIAVLEEGVKLNDKESAYKLFDIYKKEGKVHEAGVMAGVISILFGDPGDPEISADLKYYIDEGGIGVNWTQRARRKYLRSQQMVQEARAEGRTKVTDRDLADKVVEGAKKKPRSRKSYQSKFEWLGLDPEVWDPQMLKEIQEWRGTGILNEDLDFKEEGKALLDFIERAKTRGTPEYKWMSNPNRRASFAKEFQFPQRGMKFNVTHLYGHHWQRIKDAFDKEHAQQPEPIVPAVEETPDELKDLNGNQLRYLLKNMPEKLNGLDEDVLNLLKQTRGSSTLYNQVNSYAQNVLKLPSAGQMKLDDWKVVANKWKNGEFGRQPKPSVPEQPKVTMVKKKLPIKKEGIEISEKDKKDAELIRSRLDYRKGEATAKGAEMLVSFACKDGEWDSLLNEMRLDEMSPEYRAEFSGENRPSKKVLLNKVCDAVAKELGLVAPSEDTIKTVNKLVTTLAKNSLTMENRSMSSLKSDPKRWAAYVRLRDKEITKREDLYSTIADILGKTPRGMYDTLRDISAQKVNGEFNESAAKKIMQAELYGLGLKKNIADEISDIIIDLSQTDLVADTLKHAPPVDKWSASGGSSLSDLEYAEYILGEHSTPDLVTKDSIQQMLKYSNPQMDTYLAGIPLQDDKRDDNSGEIQAAILAPLKFDLESVAVKGPNGLEKIKDPKVKENFIKVVTRLARSRREENVNAVKNTKKKKAAQAAMNLKPQEEKEEKDKPVEKMTADKKGIDRIINSLRVKRKGSYVYSAKSNPGPVMRIADDLNALRGAILAEGDKTPEEYEQGDEFRKSYLDLCEKIMMVYPNKPEKMPNAVNALINAYDNLAKAMIPYLINDSTKKMSDPEEEFKRQEWIKKRSFETDREAYNSRLLKQKEKQNADRDANKNKSTKVEWKLIENYIKYNQHDNIRKVIKQYLDIFDRNGDEEGKKSFLATLRTPKYLGMNLSKYLPVEDETSETVDEVKPPAQPYAVPTEWSNIKTGDEHEPIPMDDELAQYPSDTKEFLSIIDKRFNEAQAKGSEGQDKDMADITRLGLKSLLRTSDPKYGRIFNTFNTMLEGSPIYDTWIKQILPWVSLFDGKLPLTPEQYKEYEATVNGIRSIEKDQKGFEEQMIKFNKMMEANQ